MSCYDDIMLRITSQSLFILGLLAALPLTAQEPPVDITLGPPLNSYFAGATVSSHHTFCNTTDQSVTFTVGCQCCYYEIFIENEAGEDVAEAIQSCPAMVETYTYSPGSCVTIPMNWQQNAGYFASYDGSPHTGEQVPPGRYRFRFEWTDPGMETVRTPFFVVSPVTVPTISEVGMIVLATVLALLGAFVLRRQRLTNMPSGSS